MPFRIRIRNVVSVEDFAVPDTKVIYAAVGSEEQFFEERDQPASHFP